MYIYAIFIVCILKAPYINYCGINNILLFKIADLINSYLYGMKKIGINVLDSPFKLIFLRINNDLPDLM